MTAKNRMVLVLAALAALPLLTLTPALAQTPALSAGAGDFAEPPLPAGSKQFSGVVVNEQKRPLAGIVVEIGWQWSVTRKDGTVFSGSGPAAQRTTDSQGRFVFRHLPAREFSYAVYSMTNDYVMQNGPLVIGAGDTQKTLRVVLSHGSLLTGKVVDKKTGQPVAGVFIGAGPVPPGGNAAHWEEWPTTSVARTDAQGRYQIRVMPGKVFVGVGLSIGSSATSQRVLKTVSLVAAPAGKSVVAPNLRVRLLPMLVFVGPDDQPIAGTPIRLITGNLAQGGSITEATTDASGAVVAGQRIGEPHPESGTFSIIKDDLAASGTFQWSPDGPLIVEVNGKEDTRPNGLDIIKLLPSSTSPVTGTVVSEDGTPIPNAQVRIYETAPSSRYSLGSTVTKTDIAGAFRLPLAPNGQYQAYIRADGFNQVSVSDKPLNVAAGKPTDLGTIHLLRADGFLTGTVVDTAGKPLVGVLAEVTGDKTGISAAVTDAQGSFRVPNLVVGERLKLRFCRHGEAPDSGQALFQSNEVMNIPDAYASPTPVKIVWRPK